MDGRPEPEVDVVPQHERERDR